MSNKNEIVIDQDYYVVEFREQPYMSIERYVCVPNGWIHDTGAAGGIRVAYPQKTLANIAEYIRENREPRRHWQYYKASLIFGADELKDAQKYIRDKNHMEVTKGRRYNKRSKDVTSAIYKAKRVETPDLKINENQRKELKVILQRIPEKKQRRKRPMLDNTKDNIVKKRVTVIKTVDTVHDPESNLIKFRQKSTKTPLSIEDDSLNTNVPDGLKNVKVNIITNFNDKTESQSNTSNDIATDPSNHSSRQQIHYNIENPVTDLGNASSYKMQPTIVKENQKTDTRKTYHSIIPINKPIDKSINQSDQVVQHSLLPPKQQPPICCNDTYYHNPTLENHLEPNSTNQTNYLPSYVKKLSNSILGYSRDSPNTSAMIRYDTQGKSIYTANEPCLFKDPNETDIYVQQSLHFNDKTQLNSFKNSPKPTLQCNGNCLDQRCEIFRYMQNNKNLQINENNLYLGPPAEKTCAIPMNSSIPPNSPNLTIPLTQSVSLHEQQFPPMYRNLQIQNLYTQQTFSELNNAANMYHSDNLTSNNSVMSDFVEGFSMQDQVKMFIKSKFNKQVDLGVHLPRSNNIPNSEAFPVAKNFPVPFYDLESWKKELCRNNMQHTAQKITAMEAHAVNYSDGREAIQQRDMRGTETCNNYLKHTSKIGFTQTTVNAEEYPLNGTHNTFYRGHQLLNPDDRPRQLPATLNLELPLELDWLSNSLIKEAFSNKNIRERNSQKTCIQETTASRLHSSKNYVVDDPGKVIITKVDKVKPSCERPHFPNDSNNTVAGNNSSMSMKHSNQIPEILRNNDLSPEYAYLLKNVPTQNIIATETNDRYHLTERASFNSTSMGSPKHSTVIVAHDKESNVSKTLSLGEVMNCAITSALNSKACDTNKTSITSKSNQVLDQCASKSEVSTLKNLLINEVNYKKLSNNNVKCDNKKDDNHSDTPPDTLKDTTLSDVTFTKTFENKLDNRQYDKTCKYNNSDALTDEPNQNVKQNDQFVETKCNNSEGYCKVFNINEQNISITKITQNCNNSDPDNEVFIDDSDDYKSAYIDNMFYLPPEYTPHNSRWTLKYPTAAPGVSELLPKTRIYVDEVRLKHRLTEAHDYNKLARKLLLEIFSINAINVCTLEQKRNFNKNNSVDKPVFTLDQNAKETLLEYVKEHGRINDWDQMNVAAVKASLRNKIHEIRSKLRNQT